MKRRWQQSLLLIVLIASQNLCSFAKQISPQKHFRSIHPPRHQSTRQQQHHENQPAEHKRVSRQADDGGFGSALQMVQLGMKYLPIAMNLFNSFTQGGDGGSSGIGGGGGSGGLLDLVGSILGGVTGNTKVETSAGVDPVKAASATNTVDRIDPTDLIKDDPFSMSNLIRMGIKVALAVFSSYTNDDIDRIDKVSPTQAILGTVISAVTGSENPQEVAIMAKQATDVINLLVTLVEAVGTSITS